jgi:hypothetical protein
VYEFFAIRVYLYSFIDSWYLVYDNPIPFYQIMFIWIQVWWQESLETIGWTFVNVVACQLPESDRVDHLTSKRSTLFVHKSLPKKIFPYLEDFVWIFCRLWQRDQWLKHLHWGSHHPDQSFDCKHATMNKARYACITRSCPIEVKPKVYTQLILPGVGFTLWSWVPDLFVDTNEWDYVVICCRIRLVLP